eukprot:1063632_1
MFGKLGRQIGFGSRKPGKRHDVDGDLKLLKKEKNRTLRILVMGSDDSGIAVMIKQWQNEMHLRPTEEEMQTVVPFVQGAVVGYIKVLCVQSQRLYETEGENTKITEENESLRQEILTLNAPYELNTQLASKIAFLWADHGIKETFRLRVKFQISENAEYFLDRIMVIGQDHYKPD